MKEYVLSRLIVIWNGEVPCCFHCGKELKVGQKVISRKTSHGRTKISHEECYEKTFVA